MRGLARSACGSAGYRWTEAARDGASQVAEQGLDRLLGAAEPCLLEGFNRVIADTAAAYLEGLKHQSNVLGRLQSRKRRASGAQRGAKCRHSKRPKAALGTRPGEKGSVPALAFFCCGSGGPGNASMLGSYCVAAPAWYTRISSLCLQDLGQGFWHFNPFVSEMGRLLPW